MRLVSHPMYALCLFLTIPAFAQGPCWRELTSATTSPVPRMQFAMSSDPVTGSPLVFGGLDSTNATLGDTWRSSLGGWTQLPGPAPTPRSAHAMAFDAGRLRVVLFGGYGGGNLGDTWQWDGHDWAEILTGGVSPAGRHEHAMCYDAVRDEIVIYGGTTGGSGFLDDTWVLRDSNWAQRQVSGPGPRYYHAMAFDEIHGEVVLFGGSNGVVPTNETWVWNGATWTLRSAIGPEPRIEPVMAYDPVRQRVVMHGGSRIIGTVPGDCLTDTWEWDGLIWTRRCEQAAGLQSRAQHAMCYDPNRRGVVTFGGYDGNAHFGDAWSLASAECDPDFNNDGNVDQDDVVALINTIAGGGCP